MNQNPAKRDVSLTIRQRNILITTGLIIGDLLALVLAFGVAYYIRFILLPYQAKFNMIDYIYLIGAIIPFWILIFSFSQLYNTQYLFGGLEEYIKIFTSIAVGTIAIIAFGFFKREDILISRGWLLIAWLLALFFVLSFRFFFRHTIFLLRQKGHLLSPAIIVGANDEGIALASQLQETATSGLYIAGFIDKSLPNNVKVFNSFYSLGNLKELPTIIKKNKIEEVIIAPTSLTREELLNTYRVLALNPNTSIRLSTGLFEIISAGLSIKELANVPLIKVENTRIMGTDAIIKTIMDYSIAVVSLLLLSPVFLIIAIIIKSDDPGPVFHKRRVMGINGRQFDALKFRTMKTNGDKILENYPDLIDELQKNQKLKRDPRVTKSGQILRKFSIDELPQLINILRGEMSLIGPRMISPPEMEKYGKWGMNLLIVKPGITGLWQVSGRSDIDYIQRVKLDMQYIRNWSIWLDLSILIATIPAVIKQKGAY